MRIYCRAWLLAGAALVAPLGQAAAAVGGFQLPPGGSSSPQGPVTPGVPAPRTATPAPAPTPTPAPAPVPVITVPEPAATVPVPAATPGAAPRPAASGAPQTATPAAQPTAGETPAVVGIPTAIPPLTGADETPAAEAPAASASPSTGVLPDWWPWAAGGVALAALLGAGALLLRRRAGRVEAPEIERPVIERPVVERPVVAPAEGAPQRPETALPEPAFPAAPPPPPPPASEDDGSGPLSIAVEAREMTISLGAATLAYRITLTNTGADPLGGVAISGDMVSAHASLAPEDQLASPDAALAPKHEIERIKPGESVQVTGELRLPFQMLRPIVKGSARIFVPLARLRVQAAEGGSGALVRTALVGQRSEVPGGRLQPFRLDLGPRVYREVTQKIF